MLYLAGGGRRRHGGRGGVGFGVVVGGGGVRAGGVYARISSASAPGCAPCATPSPPPRSIRVVLVLRAYPPHAVRASPWRARSCAPPPQAGVDLPLYADVASDVGVCPSSSARATRSGARRPPRSSAYSASTAPRPAIYISPPLLPTSAAPCEPSPYFFSSPTHQRRACAPLLPSLRCMPLQVRRRLQPRSRLSRRHPRRPQPSVRAAAARPPPKNFLFGRLGRLRTPPHISLPLAILRQPRRRRGKITSGGSPSLS